jgi:hypothetical protein
MWSVLRSLDVKIDHGLAEDDSFLSPFESRLGYHGLIQSFKTRRECLIVLIGDGRRKFIECD